jgi:periplasmic protein TonB
MQAEPPPPATAQQTAAPPPVAAPARAAEAAGAEALYTGRVRATIESHKRNPDGAAYRAMHPHGTVTVSFSLNRAGVANGMQVIGSSGSALLDRQAERIVAACGFPPMPAEAFPGTAAHLFQVEITFPPFVGTD